MATVDPDPAPADLTAAPGSDGVPAAAPPTSGGGGGGMGAVLALPAFRGLFVANVLGALANGSSRFVFVWLIGDLTQWNPATAILGIVIGLPGLLLSAQAGALADRIPPRRLGVALLGATTVTFAVTAALTPTSLMTVPVAMLCGLVSAIPIAGISPLFQALVPVVVPRERMLPAIALQNMGMMSSMILGAFLGGGIIAVWGTAGGFWFLAVASALATWSYARIPLPATAPGAGLDHRGSVRYGARIAFGTEPLRSLLVLSAIVGFAIAANMLLVPEHARDVLGANSFQAGWLNASMGLGMMATSLLVASRRPPARQGRLMLIVMAFGLGTGLILLGLSQSLLLSLVVALGWGAGGGITMALLRTLTQTNTPPELMGRVMGLVALAQFGMFPVASAILFVLVRLLGLDGALVTAGAIIAVLVWLQALRPHVRRL